jgi:uncharacterized protein (DUF1499 family)
MTQPPGGARSLRQFLVIALLLSLSMALGGCYVRINDITTDLDQAPVFFKAPPEVPTYHAAKYRAVQEANYPDIKNLAAAWAADDAFARVLTVIRRRGWTIAGIDERGRRVQAVAVTPFLRFRDDLIIEVRPPPPGAAAGTQSIVAMRSKSRLGRSDFGANAKRIRTFFRDLLAGP